MSKAIYSLKVTLFKDQFKLTAREEKGLTAVSMWVALVYAKFWHEAPLADRAPLNDVQLLIDLHRYPDPERAIRDASTKAFRRHLWFFSEHMIGLALFDQRVSDATKQAMVANLARPPSLDAKKRLEGATFDPRAPLEKYVSQRSLHLFDMLTTNGREKAQAFLKKPPSLWPEPQGRERCRRAWGGPGPGLQRQAHQGRGRPPVPSSACR